jgi:hypothetical protein
MKIHIIQGKWKDCKFLKLELKTLEKHDLMMVNGLVCETLNPENPIAKYYMLMAEHPENKVEMENM